MKSSTPNSYHFQTHGPDTAMGAEVVVTPGLFYDNCSSSPSEACEVIADGLKWYLLRYPFGQNLPVSQTSMVGELMDSHVDALDPSPLPSIQLWPGQYPTDLPELSRGLQQDRLAYQPKCPPL